MPGHHRVLHHGDKLPVAARDAGKKLEELADVALGDGAELVGRDDVLDVGGEALLVDRDGAGIGLLGGGDDEGVELDGLALLRGREARRKQALRKRRSICRKLYLTAR